MSKTYRQVFDEALACQNQQEADAWMASEVERYRVEFGKEEADARSIILSNLGYFAGYYDDAVAQKIYRLFGANHPIFGGHDYHKTVTPEEAFALGQKAVTK